MDKLRQRWASTILHERERSRALGVACAVLLVVVLVLLPWFGGTTGAH
jgi:hypothetical protein